jgi:(3R)-3-hydroxyacyl-CoA dehydrogenase / 3a,7a,12a-trihydroxy-5b-cholest-24-enoyl-CoA hydratase / enoyl-CoA hydratase 2
MDLNDLRIKPTAAADVGSAAIFKQIEDRVNADPATAKKINAVFLYIITKGGKEVGKWSKLLKSLFRSQ